MHSQKRVMPNVAEWFEYVATTPGNANVTMPALPEDSAAGVAAAAARELNMLRREHGLSGDVAITTNGHTTTVKVGK